MADTNSISSALAARSSAAQIAREADTLFSTAKTVLGDVRNPPKLLAASHLRADISRQRTNIAELRKLLELHSAALDALEKGA